MTIARQRASSLDAIAPPMPSGPSAPPVPPPATPGTGAPSSLGDAPAPEIVTPIGRLRRCTFRRIDRVEPLPARRDVPTYEVMCLYGDAGAPMALGDIEDARPVCEACTASGIFRPDED